MTFKLFWVRGGGSFIVVLHWQWRRARWRHGCHSSWIRVIKMTGNACFSSFHLKECICVFFSPLCSLKWRLAATGELFVCNSVASINSHQFTSVNKQAQSQRNAQENMPRWGVDGSIPAQQHYAFLLLSSSAFILFFHYWAFCSKCVALGTFTPPALIPSPCRTCSVCNHHFFSRCRQTTICVITATNKTSCLHHLIGCS